MRDSAWGGMSAAGDPGTAHWFEGGEDLPDSASWVALGSRLEGQTGARWWKSHLTLQAEERCDGAVLCSGGAFLQPQVG